VDFPGAYLNAVMPTTEIVEIVEIVRKRLDKKISELVMKLDRSYKDFLNSDGTMIVELDLALYGLKQSGRL